MPGKGEIFRVSSLLRFLRQIPMVAEWAYASWVLLLCLFGRVVNPVVVWLLIPNTFLFYWFLPLLPAAGYALIRRRFLRHIPAFLASLVFLWLYGGQLLPTPEHDGQGLLVMTYNVQRERHGAAALTAVIRDQQPAVVALQEANRRRQDRQDLTSRLEDELDFTCRYRAYYEERPSAGITVCVEPGIELMNVQRRTYHDAGKWSYFFAEARHEGRTVNVVVPHLLAFRISGSDPVRDRRRVWNRLTKTARWHQKETDALLELIKTFKDPTIMAGDFNATPGQAHHVRIRRTMTDAFAEAGIGLGATYRFWLPIRIDYIYVSRDFEVLNAHVGPRGSSDHRPVIARVRLNPVPTEPEP